MTILIIVILVGLAVIVSFNLNKGSNGEDIPTTENHKTGANQQRKSQKDGFRNVNTWGSPTVSGYGTKSDDKSQQDSIGKQESGHDQEQSRRQRAGQLECERLSGSTYYELLGVDCNATEEKIKKAWRNKDRGQYLPIELRCAFQSAYKTLSDPDERRKYDAKPRKWIYEGKPYLRREKEVLSSSTAVSKRGRQAAVSTTSTTPTSGWKSGTVRDSGTRTQSGRLSRYSYSPRRAYGGRSAYTLCPACRW